MRLNLDIWHEIVSYLKYPKDEYTLRSIAVTSRSLSDLALDAIWRDGEPILRIVSIINSFALSQNKPFLLYVDDRWPGDRDHDVEDTEDEDSSSSSDGFCGGWVLNRPIPPITCKRALEYLARIRSLAVCQDRNLSGHESIWPILLTCLGAHGHFLPNLRYLELDFHIYDRNEYLIPLLSPSLKALLVTCVGLPKRNALSTILNLAQARGCDLEDFSYFGRYARPTHEIFEPIMSFKTLKNLRLPFDRIPQEKAPVTIVQFLASLPSLRSFTCHIDTFSPLIDEDQFFHAGLQKIEIKCGLETLHDLFRICVFSSVTDARILFDKIVSMEGIESSCPNIRKLDLLVENFTDTTDQRLEFRHLASLRSLPIQSFHLRIQEHTLTPSNLCDFSQSWPNLRRLKIHSNAQLDPLPSLDAFSNHQYLDDLDIRLPLYRLLDDIPKMREFIGISLPTQDSNKSPLRSLSLHSSIGGPNSMQTPLSEGDKHVFVEYLLRLFPNVNLQFAGGYYSCAVKPAELQEILVKRREEALNSA